jgi:hypothetical protein
LRFSNRAYYNQPQGDKKARVIFMQAAAFSSFEALANAAHL